MDEPKRWLDDPDKVQTLYRGLWVLAVLFLVGDFLYSKHVHYAVENSFGFFGFFGFICYVLIVISATRLRKILQRDEDYYDR